MTEPERIGKYTIAGVLGKGAMGTVYKGFDPHIQRTVAIKTVHKALLGDDDGVDSVAARFRNEAQAVGRIAHPGVVAIYEFGEDERTAYIAMEFVEGRDLDDILAATPMLPEARLLDVMDQLLDALGAAHAQGVWHRDVKPANLILTPAGQVKLTDFGVARIADANLTQAASMIGTPGYMAPEQFIGEGVDHRCDLFACGVVLYRLLTGQRAFVGPAEVVMYKILNEHPAPPSQLTQGARAAAWDAVVARAMAKRADDRFQSAQEMRQALRDVARRLDAAAGAAAQDDDDRTVILAPARRPAGMVMNQGASGGAVDANGASAASAATGMAAGTGVGTAIVPVGWDPSELSRVERALAAHVGPMARVMVRQAARACADVASLAEAVAQHIPDGSRREQFLAGVHGGSQVSPAGPSSGIRPAVSAEASRAAVSTAAGATGPADPLTDEFKAQALQVVTRKMGPIARVMVRRAAEQSGASKGRFVQLLLDGASEAERAVLQRDLAALG